MAKYKISTVNNSVIVQFDDDPPVKEVLDFIAQKNGYIADGIYIRPERIEIVERVVIAPSTGITYATPST